MKALIVISGENISDDKMNYLTGNSMASFKRIAPNSFLLILLNLLIFWQSYRTM